METAELKALCAVVEKGSFTLAAQELNTPKSAVSQRVSKLEGKLGTPLLARTTRRVHLTEAGQLFYNRARLILEEMHDAAQQVSQLSVEPSGVLRVSLVPDLGEYILENVFSVYNLKFPQVRLDIDVSRRVVDLTADRFDLALRVGIPTDQNLVARKIGQVRFGLYASAQYLKNHEEVKNPTQLSQHSCLSFNIIEWATEWTLEQLGSPQEPPALVPLRRTVKSNSLFFLQRMALSHQGIALLPTFLENCEPAFQGLQRVLPSWTSPGGMVYLVTAPRPFLTAKVKCFLDLYEQHAPEFHS